MSAKQQKAKVIKAASLAGRGLWHITPVSNDTVFTAPLLRKYLIEYFEWCERSPMEEETIGWHKGSPSRAIIYKPHVMTLKGLCVYIGIQQSRWESWRKSEKLKGVVEWAEAIIWEQKYSNAAVGLFNATLIARDLGLAEKVETTGADGAAIEHQHRLLADVEAFTDSIARIVERKRTEQLASAADPRAPADSKVPLATPREARAASAAR